MTRKYEWERTLEERMIDIPDDVQRAIERSTSHNEWVTLPYSDERADVRPHAGTRARLVAIEGHDAPDGVAAP